MNKILTFFVFVLLLTATPVMAEETDAVDVPEETMQYGEGAIYETEIVPVITNTDYNEIYAVAVETLDSEEAEMISPEISREIRVMNENTGAKIRMLQLERSARITYAKSNTVLTYIKNKYPETDITALEEIMKEMNYLAEEVKEHKFIEYEQKENIELFVSWRKQGQELTRAFREESNKILTEEDKELLRQRFAEIEKKAAEKLDETIAQNKREHNAQILQRSFEKMGAESTTLVERVKTGEITPRQIKERIILEYNSLEQERRTEIAELVKIAALEQREGRIELIKEARLKELELAKELRQRQAESIQERIKMFEQQRREQVREDVVGDARSRAMAASFNGNGMPGNQQIRPGNGGLR